jgi:hypothetical protein
MALASSAVETGACSTASGDGFVVSEGAVAEQEVVHCALTCGGLLEGLED